MTARTFESVSTALVHFSIRNSMPLRNPNEDDDEEEEDANEG